MALHVLRAATRAPRPTPPASLDRETRRQIRGDLGRRGAIGALALIGAASMTATSLLQLGVVDDLPDPSGTWFGLPFDSRQVNLSDEAFVFGLRDGPIALLGFAATAALAALGGRHRAARIPWLPLGILAETIVQAGAALDFFLKMPRVEHKWCIYCLAATATSVAIAALAVPEAIHALRVVRREP